MGGSIPCLAIALCLPLCTPPTARCAPKTAFHRFATLYSATHKVCYKRMWELRPSPGVAPCTLSQLFPVLLYQMPNGYIPLTKNLQQQYKSTILVR
ncbi:MAG TPA: hypothetical protein IGS53_09880 [Leptolyngbyaceae cyanobacterium M33_DOE_097]|uniref:Secreted protein n=1 Tax=Oscillatoriales cyanobacterium SpSt-418 TaxID=2282169 RepID=A0A7C3PSL3_9CYAN|nr:hypothetical protein [Leptolyngbyaceae cyanobacterium M33_DOE_097]